jgi:ACS family D-galactonate transporter-like MFS transporter
VRVAATPFRLFALAVAGQFLFGIVLALPGTLFGLPRWTMPLGFDVPAQAQLLVVFFAGQFLFTAVAGSLVDRIGCQRVLALGAAIISVALGWLALAGSAAAAMPPALVLAAGGASINASSNTLVSVTYGERRGAMLSLMATFGAIGALSAPVVFLGSPSIEQVTARIGALTVFAAAVAALPLMIADTGAHGGGQSLLASVRLLRERPLLGLIALLGLEFGDEAVLAGWTAAFAIAVFPGTTGAMFVACYWLGLCAGRLAAPALLKRAAKLVVVLAASFTTAAAVVGMATAPTVFSLGVCVFIAGFAVGPLAPTTVSVAGDRYPRQMGAAIGLLLSVAQLGGMVLPWLTGRVTVEYGYRAGLLVPAAAALGITIGTALAWRARARRPALVLEPEA